MIEIVLTPGARAGDVAAGVQRRLSAEHFPPRTTLVEADLWTYHDPTKSTDFRRMMADLFPGPVGFPDYRGTLVETVTGRFDLETGAQIGNWQAARVYSDPARERTGT